MGLVCLHVCFYLFCPWEKLVYDFSEFHFSYTQAQHFAHCRDLSVYQMTVKIVNFSIANTVTQQRWDSLIIFGLIKLLRNFKNIYEIMRKLLLEAWLWKSKVLDDMVIWIRNYHVIDCLRVRECLELIRSFIYSTLGMLRRGTSYYVPCSILGNTDTAVSKGDKNSYPLEAYTH